MLDSSAYILYQQAPIPAIEEAPAPVALFDLPEELPEGSKRAHAVPKRYKQFDYSKSGPLAAVFIPPETTNIAENDLAEPVSTAQPTSEDKGFITEKDSVGLYRIYADEPANIPKTNKSLSPPEPAPPSPSLFAPFKNFSSYALADWVYTGENNKSQQEVMNLVKTVILDKDFDKEELSSFSMRQTNNLLDEWEDDSDTEAEGWKSTTVKIKVPTSDHVDEKNAPEIEIDGLWYRSFTDIIKEHLAQGDTVPQTHIPYKEYWEPKAGSSPQRVYGELYSSDFWLDAHENLQKSLPPQDPDDKIENVVLPLMFWSDSTRLTNFGTASLWPLYMFFGAHSKYARSKPALNTGCHVAYIPQVNRYRASI